MDIVEQLRKLVILDEVGSNNPLGRDAADEIERLRQNAKIDAEYLAAYHYICQQHGIAPSSSDLMDALKAVAAAKATGGE